MDIVSRSAQEISCKIDAIQENLMWFHSFVYGGNKGIERRQLWHYLVLVKAVVASSP